ncbi:MAG: C40 family peptidase [Pseudobutyrivibrio sp.]|nr:C40 family peptidase [Pseudobutyrivibrio sp.]
MKSIYTKRLSAALATCLLASALAVDANAANDASKKTATAGITAVASGAYEVTPFSAFAGMILTAGNILSDSNAIATANVAQIEASLAEEVAASEYAGIGIARVDNYVYIRPEVNVTTDYVGKLYNKSACTVLESVLDEDGAEWLHITSGDVTGFVKSEYIIQGNEDYVKECSRRAALVECETLFVREQPTTESKVIDMVPYSDDLTVLDESTVDAGWVMITCDAGEGFVSAEYVSLFTEYTLAESKEAEEARLAREEAARKAAQAAAAKAAKKSSSSSTSSSSSETVTYSEPTGSAGSDVIAYAAQFLGNPYVYGGSSLTNGTDCSGFVMSVYAAFGVSLPHSSSSDRSVGYAVDASAIAPGDIVCYSGHVGLYAGNGQIIHASNARTGIIYSDMSYKKILAIRRIF